MTKLTFDQSVSAKLATMRKGNDYVPLAITASIKSIKGRGATLDVDIHATAVACIHTSMAHGDATGAERLVNAMPKGSRRKALVAWFTAFSNVSLVLNGKTNEYKGTMHAVGTKLHKLARPQDAQAKPFWSVDEKEQDPAAFDNARFANAVAALIKRATGDTAKLDAAGKAALADLQVIGAKLAPVQA